MNFRVPTTVFLKESAKVAVPLSYILLIVDFGDFFENFTSARIPFESVIALECQNFYLLFTLEVVAALRLEHT